MSNYPFDKHGNLLPGLTIIGGQVIGKQGQVIPGAAPHASVAMIPAPVPAEVPASEPELTPEPTPAEATEAEALSEPSN